MDARSIVTEFVRRMIEVTGQAGETARSSTGGGDIWALCTAVNQRRMPRIGVLPGGLHYSVHGVGCLITAPDGAEIDVDLVPERPRLKFDAWRVGMFAESIGESSVGLDDLGAALEQLASEGLVTRLQEPYGAWYTSGEVPSTARSG